MAKNKKKARVIFLEDTSTFGEVFAVFLDEQDDYQSFNCYSAQGGNFSSSYDYLQQAHIREADPKDFIKLQEEMERYGWELQVIQIIKKLDADT